MSLTQNAEPQEQSAVAVKPSGRWWSWLGALTCVVLAAVVPGLHCGTRPEGGLLRVIVASLPGVVIVNHWVYLSAIRKRQFQMVTRKGDGVLEGLYFNEGSLLTRYVVPAVVFALTVSAAICAFTNPKDHLPWLLAHSEWGSRVLRGGVLGLIGAYVYSLPLLIDRARRRDVTTGVVLWVLAMPVLGTLAACVTAFLVKPGAGVPSEVSFSQDAICLVAGMLPREVLAFIQANVRRAFHMDAGVATRSLPLTVLSSVGPEVENRLQEEGIFDVATLAYASPYFLMRTTTYAARQIATWIDEALLVVLLPAHWEVLERLGITGASDLAWYAKTESETSRPGEPPTKRDELATIAREAKIDEQLLWSTAVRLNHDGQVRDIQVFYHAESGS